MVQWPPSGPPASEKTPDFMSDEQQSSECTTHRKRYSKSLEYFTCDQGRNPNFNFVGEVGSRPFPSFHFPSLPGLPSLFSSLSPPRSAPQIQLISWRAVSSPSR